MTLVRVDRGETFSATQVRQALRGRCGISHATFAAYVALRSEPVLEELVRACLCGEKYVSVLAGARLRRRLKHIGPYTQREWSNLFSLSDALERCTRSEIASQERVAMDLGMAARTLSIWTRDYLQTTWRLAVGLGAWEPVLERALRVAGYVSMEEGRHRQAEA